VVASLILRRADEIGVEPCATILGKASRVVRSKKMDTKAPNLIPSGIEPVDKLLGGLESGQLYLVHGEGAGKSLFGIKFLIEGLKRGEHGALVIRYSPEDAVRRFARLGYDCLEDVYSGRLVILEYSDDIIQQVSRLREMTPVLRELEWLLGETKPQRLIFDPVTSLVAGVGNLQSRAGEFTAWARSFGATVVFIANGDADVVEAVKPQTAEVIRFQVKDVGERAARFITFEKRGITDQAIEVDPSRGIFLLDRGRDVDHFFSVFQAMPPATGEATADEISVASTTPLASETAAPLTESRPPEPVVESSGLGKMSDFDLDKLLEPFAEMARANTSPATTEAAERVPPAAVPLRDADTQAESPASAPHADATPAAETTALPQAPATVPLPRAAQLPTAAPPSAPTASPSVNAASHEPSTEVFADLIDELSQSESPLDIEMPEHAATQTAAGQPPAPTPPAAPDPRATGELLYPPPPAPAADESTLAPDDTAANATVEPPATPHRRAADHKIDSAIAAHATEALLRPPDASGAPLAEAIAPEPAGEAAEPLAVQPQDCKVLVIDDDPASCALVAQTLDCYSLEAVHDGMSGLAKLISCKPDLVVLSLDLPIIDGFKVLEHIRQGLNVPVILTTSTRMRAGDRVLAAELGADYYLAKPYSANELRHKARQLIARYRGINSWIAGAATTAKPAAPAAPTTAAPTPAEPVGSPAAVEHFTSYQQFTAQVEDRVRATLENNATFAIVGCRVPQMTAKGGHTALRLYDLVRRLVRENDLLSTNPRNDIVILLTDANANGARAFISRLRERVVNDLHQEPGIWLRSFPDLEESAGAKDWTSRSTNGGSTSRRAADQLSAPDPAHPADSAANRM
jgi:DNA-binding response OmpR family regulator/KaiC/GvpD/RAD55 family RecA-like ATPase